LGTQRLLSPIVGHKVPDDRVPSPRPKPVAPTAIIAGLPTTKAKPKMRSNSGR
jgi:hypothetical protein